MKLNDLILEKIIHKIEGQEGSITTQVKNTGPTYKASGQKLKDKIPPDGRVLNYGAGLDHTTEALKDGLGGEHSKHTVHSYEPFPENRKQPPTFSKSEEVPEDHYHAVVCHNVLNTVEPHIRKHIVHHILSTMKEGAIAHVGGRKWKGDIDKIKNCTPADEKNAVWVDKGKNGKVYQCGLTPEGLHDAFHAAAKEQGHEIEVKRTNLAAAGVEITMKKRNKTTNESFDVRTILESENHPAHEYLKANAEKSVVGNPKTAKIQSDPSVHGVYKVHYPDKKVSHIVYMPNKENPHGDFETQFHTK